MRGSNRIRQSSSSGISKYQARTRPMKCKTLWIMHNAHVRGRHFLCLAYRTSDHSCAQIKFCDLSPISGISHPDLKMPLSKPKESYKVTPVKILMCGVLVDVISVPHKQNQDCNQGSNNNHDLQKTRKYGQRFSTLLDKQEQELQRIVELKERFKIQ